MGRRIYADVADIFAFPSAFCTEVMSSFSARRRGNKHIKQARGVADPTLRARILHPILHPKSLENTTGFVCGCRKCRRFRQNFFERFYGAVSQITTMQIVHDPQKTFPDSNNITCV